MKIAPFVAAVSAQLPDLGNFDLSNFDLSQFGLGPAIANVEVPVPDAVVADDFVAPGTDDERYFFTQASTTSTTTTTTTQTPRQGNACWKCDQMTYDKCSSEGYLEVCEKGDKDCCFVEIRETAQSLQQLCTGCKDKNACENLRDENFVGTNQINHQCRPDYRQQMIGRFNRSVQSVCRQCFNTCDNANPTTTQCFGNHGSKGSHHQFTMPFSAKSSLYNWNGYYRGADVKGMGIPTGAAVASTDAVAADIAASTGTGTALVDNVYFQEVAGKNDNDAKLYPGNEATANLYWGLQGASRTWWQSDLKAIQDQVTGTVPTAANLNGQP